MVYRIRQTRAILHTMEMIYSRSGPTGTEDNSKLHRQTDQTFELPLHITWMPLVGHTYGFTGSIFK